MKAQLKNWQTTICGALLAGLMVIAENQQGSDLTDWTEWLVPVAIAVIGFLARDAGRSTEQSIK